MKKHGWNFLEGKKKVGGKLGTPQRKANSEKGAV